MKKLMTSRITVSRLVAAVSALALVALLVPVTTAFANHAPRTLQVRHGDGNDETTGEISGERSAPATLHTLVAVLEDTTGNNELAADIVSGPINVDFEIESGPGDISGTGNEAGNTPANPDLTCTAEVGQSRCSVQYQSNAEGTDVIRAWIDHDKNDETVEADTAEGRISDQATDECQSTSGSCRETPDPGLEAEPDDTDVVRVIWSFPATITTLDCEPDSATNPSTGSGSSEEYTCTLKSATGQPVEPDVGYTVDGENLAGANDPDNNAQGTPSGADETSSGQDRPDYDHEHTGAGTLDNGHFCTISTTSTSCSDTVTAQDNEAGEARICFWAAPSTDHEPVFDPDGDETVGGGCDDEAFAPSSEDADFTDVVVKNWQARAASRGGVDAEPESDTNNQGDSHTITATVYDQFGEPFVSVTRVRFEFFQGSPTDTDGNTPASADRFCDTKDPVTESPASSCSITYSQTKTGKDLVCVWTNETPSMSGNNNGGTCNGGNGAEGLTDADDEPGSADAPQPANDDVDVVEKNWVDPNAPAQLDCNPETDTNPTGTTHEIVCRVTNTSSGFTGPQPVGDVNVDAEATGANDPDSGNTPTSPDFTCTTASQDDPATPSDETGTCTIRHGPQGTGTTNSTGVTTYRAWIDSDGNDSTSEADTTEGRDETASGQAGTTPEPDTTDVVEKTWVPQPTTLTMTPENDTASVGECNPYTITMRDTNNNPTQGATVDVEQTHSAATNSTANDEPDVQFCRPSTGPNPSDVDEARGDMVENPDNQGTAGGETLQSTDGNGQITIGIRVAPAQGSDGTGTVTVTAFFDPNENDDPDPGEPSDTSGKTWTEAQADQIDCEPETATTSVNDSHTVTCTVTDEAGNPASGVLVTFTEQGPGSFASQPEQETNAQGQASVRVASQQTGEQTITGTTENGESDSVTNTWTQRDEGETCPGFENDPRNQVVGTQDDDVLTGTEDDDIICGLGGNDTIEGRGGDDLILGGGGKDLIDAGEGDDTVRGGNKNDNISGRGGNDELFGQGGFDTLKGNAGNDKLRGAAGNDIIQGGGGADHARGGSGKDVIKGFVGADTLIGNADDDVIKGAAGDDTLRGGRGNDTLNGGAGKDRCGGGPGDDRLRRCE